MLTKSIHTKFFLRKALSSDLEWLVNLRKQTMESYLKESGADASRENLVNRVLYHFQDIQIIELDNKDIGMLKLSKEDNNWNLIQIQLLPEYQNCGLGTSLIKNIISEAKKEGVSLTLSVLKVNPARFLYESLGFRLTKEDEHACEMKIEQETE